MRMMIRGPGRWGLAALLALAWPAAAVPAHAHWCSNIWNAPARLVVKPETSTVLLKAGQPTKLRVYLQNNFPYKLVSAQLRGEASGYTVTVSPASQDIYPGQQAGFELTITRASGTATVKVSTLGLQVQFRPGKPPSGWMGESHTLVKQDPAQSTLLNGTKYSMKIQDASLIASTLSRLYPTVKLASGVPYFGRTGIQQVIHWFGYRFCYSSSGSWRCGGQQCPSACAEGNAWSATNQFPFNCMRAGMEVAAWHARARLGSDLSAARDAAVNALKGGGSFQHKCMAAVVGAYLLQGSASTLSLTSALDNASNNVPPTCRKAARRILDGSNASTSCGSGQYYENAACAGAEGLRGNDSVVKSVLVAKAGDGGGWGWGSGGYDNLYYAMMLYIVTAHRSSKDGKVTYYPDAGAPFTFKPDTKPVGKDAKVTPDTKPGQDQQVTPQGGGASGDDDSTDRGCSCGVASSGKAPALLVLVLVGLVIRRRRQQRLLCGR